MTGTAIIIDDEVNAVEFLKEMIGEVVPSLQVIGSALDSENAIRLYNYSKPDLIFMDIKLDHRSGFEVISEIYSTGSKPYVIFVTAFNKHAIEAFKQNALDYLLKPVRKEDLHRAITRFYEQYNKDRYQIQILDFLERNQGLRFNTRQGFIYLNPEDILYLEASQNYTRVYMRNSRSEVISLNLSSVEEKLADSLFWRISRSHIVNSIYLHKVDRVRKQCLLRNEGEEILLKLSPTRLKSLPV